MANQSALMAPSDRDVGVQPLVTECSPPMFMVYSDASVDGKAAAWSGRAIRFDGKKLKVIKQHGPLPEGTDILNAELLGIAYTLRKCVPEGAMGIAFSDLRDIYRIMAKYNKKRCHSVGMLRQELSKRVFQLAYQAKASRPQEYFACHESANKIRRNYASR